MTLNFEAEVNVPFDFDVEALAGEVINFTLEHEDFPYEEWRRSRISLPRRSSGGLCGRRC